MSTSVNGTSGSSGSSGTNNASNVGDALNNVDLNSFIQMLVAELQNQDPTQPMDNSQILSQVSEMKAIATNQELSNTLQSVLLAQNVTTASSLLGRTVQGTDADGVAVSGQVTSVSIDSGTATLHVGNNTLPFANVTSISPSGSGAAATTTGS
jgi:flagellar hook assembly protein FlgD